MSSSFKLFNDLKIVSDEVKELEKVIARTARFWRIAIFLILFLSALPQTGRPYDKCELNKLKYRDRKTVFGQKWRSLYNIPTERLSFFDSSDKCTFHESLSSNNIPRYLIL